MDSDTLEIIIGILFSTMGACVFWYFFRSIEHSEEDDF
jgi:hypothetical protein